MLQQLSLLVTNFSIKFSEHAEPFATEICDPELRNWDEITDIAVVGFGGAGAAAAIEARDQGAEVTVLERFNGGGATAISGGVVYAGGGTHYQKANGFEDTPEEMFKYLKEETREAISDEMLQRFCDESKDNLLWLEKQGVVFGATLCPFKTSYPVNKYQLYYSGNETFPPYNQKSIPAPRGHRPQGKGLSGSSLFKPMARSALNKGVRVHYQSRVRRLYTDKNGAVVGIEYFTIPEGTWSQVQTFMVHSQTHLRYLCMMFPLLLTCFNQFFVSLEASFSISKKMRVRKGVILSTGGFIYNRMMVDEQSPLHNTGTPLGTTGDDGLGIKLGMNAGGETQYLNRISAWRFINPPVSFVHGVLVGRNGKRLCNEQLYGAQMGDTMVKDHGGEGFLIIDSKLWKRTHAQISPNQATWFQTALALTNLYLNHRRGQTLDVIAKKYKIDADQLKQTLEDYNRRAKNKEPDPTGKASTYLEELTPPYLAINCSVNSRLFPCAVLTLGGLKVDEHTGQVQNKEGKPIKGLYAAGKTAVGISSQGYVSGLSLADCIFSGRRAGKHASSS
ncbi:FAD-binding protein [Deltaproteobacteria bacterium TL4]